MDIDIETQSGVKIMKVSGRLDANTFGDLEKSVAEAAGTDSARIVLDFGGLEYISSAGLRSILSSTKKLQAQGGSLALCSLAGMVEEVISLSGFDTFLSIYDDAPSAIAGECGNADA